MCGERSAPVVLLPLSLCNPPTVVSRLTGRPRLLSRTQSVTILQRLQTVSMQPTPVVFPDVVSEVRASAPSHCLHKWISISGRRVQGSHTDHLCKVSLRFAFLTRTAVLPTPPPLPLRHLSSSWFQAGFPPVLGLHKVQEPFLYHISLPPRDTGHILISLLSPTTAAPPTRTPALFPGYMEIFLPFRKSPIFCSV